MTLLTYFVKMKISVQIDSSFFVNFLMQIAIKRYVIVEGGKKMTNEKALKALRQIKTYCSATQLEELDYVIEVIEKLEKDGIKEPLATDFKSLAK